MEEKRNPNPHLHQENYAGGGGGGGGGGVETIQIHRRPVPPPPRLLALPPMVRRAANQVKLAAVAVDLNVRLRSSDMPGAMQERAFRCTRAFLDSSPDRKRPNPSRLAMSLKKEFDGAYGPAWHCIAGKSFGSFVTHASGGFVYFSVDEKLCLLLFKTEVRPVVKSKPPPSLLKLTIK